MDRIPVHYKQRRDDTGDQRRRRKRMMAHGYSKTDKYGKMMEVHTDDEACNRGISGHETVRQGRARIGGRGAPVRC